MIKTKHLALSMLAIFTITSCGSNGGEHLSEIDTLISTMRKGFNINGEIIKTSRYYTNDNYDVINSALKPTQKKYQFDYTYQNSLEDSELGAYTGVDRNLYYIDHNANDKPRMIIDDNLYEKDNGVMLNSLMYDNTLEFFQAVDDNDDEGLNLVSYGASGLLNPFLSIGEEDFTKIGENTYSITNDKVSSFILDMFVNIDDLAFSMPVHRNILTFDKNNVGIDKMFIYLDEYRTLLTDGNNYQNLYVGQSYTISLTFSDEGVADARSKLTPYAQKEENAPLRTIFDRMENKNLKSTRKDVTIYDGVVHTENYETIVNYFDGKKIFYQVYDSAYTPNGPEYVTSSDFLLLTEKDSGLMFPYGRESNGNRRKANEFNRIGGYPYKSYLPVIGDISENIFTLDKATGIYHCPEYLANYFTIDGCLIPTMVVSSPIYQQFTNDVQIKLKSNGDIEWVRLTCYLDVGSFIQEGYYEMTYEYGDQVKMPYDIDSEISSLEGVIL